MNTSEAQWSWPEDLPPTDKASEQSNGSGEFTPQSSREVTPTPSSNPEGPREPPREASQEPTQGNANSRPRQQRRRHYPPRQCRICLDEVQPQFIDQDAGAIGGFMGTGSKPVYISDPELGRLISPCKCSGSSKYVHEGCLQAWRAADKTVGNVNFFSCPTCGYRYQLARLSWGRRLQSGITRLAVTLAIFMLSVFILGFFADTIFNIWQDPVGTLADKVAGVLEDIEPTAPEPIPDDGTWWEHFVKGFLSLGIIGFAKYLLALTPWQWWNIRSTGMLGSAVRRRGGRARMEDISWALVVIGAVTFIYTVWKTVNKFTYFVLKRVGDGVLDVGGDDDYTEEEPAPDSATGTQGDREDR